MNQDLDLYINNNLHKILGISELSIVEYIRISAKNAKSLQDFKSDLASNLDFPLEKANEEFLTHIFSNLNEKANAKPNKPSNYELEELRKTEKIKKSSQYRLIDSQEIQKTNIKTPQELEKTTKKPQETEKKSSDTGKRASNSESLEDNLQKKQHIEGKEDNPEDFVKKKEAEMDEDIKKRDEMDKRIKEKDLEKKLKKIIENPQAAQISMTPEEKLQIIADLKQHSRFTYLTKREEQQLDLFKRKLMDEKQTFADFNLTSEEKRIDELNNKIFDLAMKQRSKTQDINLYQFPTPFDEEGANNKQKKYKVLFDRYEEVKTELNEHQLWEKGQTEKATMKHNIITADEPDKKYEYVFENQIDFIKTDLLQEMNIKKKQKQRGDIDEANLSQEDEEAPVVETSAQKQSKTPLQLQRESLPIYPHRARLLETIRDHQIIVLVGETGSGKTTQIPQYLHEIGYTKTGKIGCTQPRRVAAMSVAARVSQEVGCKIGHEVGYSIRFEDCTSDKTVIKYMTDGMLLREFLLEPDLKSYSVMMIDEAHERTLHTDILFGLMKDLTRARPDLKLIISSATLDAEKFAGYFDDAFIIKIPGRRYPVDIYYTKAPEADYVEATVITALQIHVTQPRGDILAFLTGQEEIETTQELLTARTRGLGSKIGELIILPIYSSLPSDMQAKIFEPTPPGARKIVLATNIAETSLTIDNIIYVIDCGFSKQTTFNPRTGMESLIVTPISKASANQRAGRAGRVAPGKCFRLYTLWSFLNELDETTIPEIQRTNMSNVVLMLKSMGVNNLVNFDFMDPPPHEMLVRALEQLYALAALNDRGELTRLGRRMAEFPVDPMLAKIIIQSENYKCVDQILTIVSMLSVGNSIFYRPKDKALHADNAKLNFVRYGGDHLALLNVYNIWKDTNFSAQWCYENFIQIRSMRRSRDIKEQLIGLCERVEIDINDTNLSVYEDEYNTNIRKCITSGYFYNAAKGQKNGTYKTLKNPHSVMIHPGSFVFKDEPEWVIFHELVHTTKEYMRNLIEIKPEWLTEIAPHYYKDSDIKEPVKKVTKNKGTAEMRV